MSKVRKVSLAKLDEFFSAIAHSERLYLPVDTAAGAEYAVGETLSPETIRDITRPPFSSAVYRTILENVWRRERESGDGIKETSR